MQGMVPPSTGPSLSSLILELMIVSSFIAAAVYLLHRHDQPILEEEVHDKQRNHAKPWMISTIMLILVFFGPISLNIYPGMGSMGGYVYIFAMTWQITDLASMSFFMFDTLIVMAAFLLTFMRPVFVYQLARYYKGRTTRGRTIIVGLISELQFTIITALLLLFLFSNPVVAYVFMIAVPVPVLLFLGLLFMWRIPVPEISVPWKELDEPKDWWEEKAEASTDAIFEGN